MRISQFACAFASMSSFAFGADIYVDASGQSSAFTNIDAAMLTASPGDRILVYPGLYPSFHFGRGVAVIGLGAPSDVQVERVDFHPNIPNDNFTCLISNIEVVGNLPESGIAFTGNELSTGTLVLDGVIIHGGVFLRGGPDGFHLLLQNTRIEPQTGDGFSGEAFWFGGKNNTVEIVDCLIQGAPADGESGALAGVGLRLAGGTHARIARSQVFGGDGEAGTSGSAKGGAAIANFGSTPSQVRIDGGSVVRGGAGTNALGGAGASFFGSIALGEGQIEGGSGVPSGPPAVNAALVTFPSGFHMASEPARIAGVDAAYHPGDVVSISFEATPAMMLVSTTLQDPAGSSFFTMPPTAIALTGNALTLPIPTDLGISAEGLFLYFQGFALVGAPSKVEMTHVTTIRIDL